MAVKRNPKQYSKIWMTRWQIFVMFWTSVFMIADIHYNGAMNAVTIVNSLVVSVVACMIPYFAKSFFETKEENRLDFEREKFNSDSVG